MTTRREIVAKYKHIGLEEGLILERFIDQTRLKGNWKFDVRLEVSIEERHYWESKEGYYAWVSLKAKRIDALLEIESDIHIFEVKKTLNFAQFGQLLTYHQLYNEQFRPKGLIYLHALCERIDPEIAKVMKGYNIQVHRV